MIMKSAYKDTRDMEITRTLCNLSFGLGGGPFGGASSKMCRMSGEPAVGSYSTSHNNDNTNVINNDKTKLS